MRPLVRSVIQEFLEAEMAAELLRKFFQTISELVYKLRWPTDFVVFKCRTSTL